MMVCGKGPFNHANDSETLTMIMDCRYDLPPNLSTRCKRLVEPLRNLNFHYKNCRTTIKKSHLKIIHKI